MGCPTPAEEVQPFADVRESDYFCRAVQWAVGAGVTQGTDETHFSPRSTCTDEEFLRFLWRSLGTPGQRGEKLAGYDDALAWAQETSMLENISAEDPCLRCEAVTLLYRALA